MPGSLKVLTVFRFEGFELDVRAGELRRPDGAKARLGEQPLRILLVLLENPGGVVLREEIRKRLWPNDTIVEFEHSIGAAMSRLRQALGDCADKPRYIETLARRGFRWLTEVERVEESSALEAGESPDRKGVKAANGQLIGKTVSHYRVLEVLGAGGMGIVYKAEDIKLGRQVALKFLPDGMASDPRALRRFEREALAISGLDHPNICTIYEVEEHAEKPFLVMQLLEGQTLRERIESHATNRAYFQNEELLDISLQIASGLEAAHRKGMIHRDIKPANIFLTNRGEAKILDFGLAKFVESGELSESLSPQVPPDASPIPESAMPSTITLGGTALALGTPAYLSPEQVSGEKLDARTDVYSFGLVLYEMATGIRAMAGNTAPEICESILDKPPRPVREMNPAASRGLEQIINRAINKDREARYCDGSEMREDLLRLKRGASTIRRREIGIAAALVFLSIFGAIFWAARRGSRDVPPTLNPVPFTTYPGIETNPTFSPDGSEIAFAWDGGPASGSKGFDLYVKMIGSENLLRLTYHPSEAVSPAWSPDGTRIAFHRVSGADTGVYVVPALGGPERKLRSTRIPYGGPAPISWSPDGKLIAFVDLVPPTDSVRLHLLSLETLESKQISHAAECLTQWRPAFSHSGKELAYTCLLKADGNDIGIYSNPSSGGPPKLVTRFTTGWGWPKGIAWTVDDKKLILARPHIRNDFELDEISLADGTLSKLSFGQDAINPAISAGGDKLAYVVSPLFRNDIWRKDLLHPEAAAVKLITSTRDQGEPQYSPDGKHIAFSSNRGGISEIWMSDAAGSHLVRMSDAKSAESDSARWSPDSQKIAFNSRHSGHPEVYVVDISERMPRKLVTNLSAMMTPSWSHDGQWIYFASNGPDNAGLFGPTRVFRCPANGGNAVALSTGEGLFPLESYDGETVYFTNRNIIHPVNAPSLRMISLKVGRESILRGMPEVSGPNMWTVVPEGIYYVPAGMTNSLWYFDFGTKQVRQIFDAEKFLSNRLSISPDGNGLSVSPDGRWVLYSQADETNSEIMLVDHFR